jgi:hypothetical protein
MWIHPAGALMTVLGVTPSTREETSLSRAWDVTYALDGTVRTVPVDDWVWNFSRLDSSWTLLETPKLKKPRNSIRARRG